MELRNRKTVSIRPDRSKTATVGHLKTSNVTALTELTLVFGLFLISRLFSALYNNINDCDETFNYWEPAHFLLFKNGFQTWEYSPNYSIRSYFYLWLYIFPAWLLKSFFENKIFLFYFTRSYISLVNAVIETFFYSVIQQKFNSYVAKLYCFISLFSPGMFISTTAFLPSAFAQTMALLSIGFWFLCHYKSFVFCTAFSAIVGWPFSAAISLPAALYVLSKHTFKFVVWSIIFGIPITLITLLIDTFYYGKYVCTSVNILLYNVFSLNGPELYGTEPFSFYLFNLLLNYNIVFIISVISPIVLMVFSFSKKFQMKNVFEQFFSIVSLFVWFLIFGLQAHKEERFMFPAYPLISLTAAFTIHNIYRVREVTRPIFQKILSFSIFGCLFVYFLFSVSRIAALQNGYSASIRIYDKLAQIQITDLKHNNEIVLCLGKEWHRFPSNFFIPKNFRVEFISSEFRGQLPKHFDSSSKFPTRIIPTYMNDQNKEELSRYVPLDSCDFIIDSDYLLSHGRDLSLSRDSTSWSIQYGLPFLDSSRSSKLFRAFYIPILSTTSCTYVNYNLLANKNRTTL